MADLQQVLARLRERMEQDGIRFAKCANCGTTYPLGHEGWDDTTVCSQRCFYTYLAYLNDLES